MKRKNVIIAPSILSADFARLADEVSRLEKAGADWLHVDVMDGHFVPNITVGPPVIKQLKKVTRLPLDVHLMIERPERYIEVFREAGADWLTVHAEASIHIERLLRQIRSTGARAGLSFNPATPVDMLEYVMNELDMVLLMTVNPGFGGQSFIDAVVPKIVKVRSLIDRHFRNSRKTLSASDGKNARSVPLIEVDGGITDITARTVRRAGADVLVAGNFILCSGNPETAIRALRAAR